MKGIRYILFILVITMLPSFAGALNRKQAELNEMCNEIVSSSFSDNFLEKCQKLEQRARELKQKDYEEIACNLITYYYLYNHVTEDLSSRVEKMDSLTQFSKNYRKRFVSHYLAINRYNQIYDYSAALTMSNRLFLQATKLNDSFCMKIATLGLFNTFVSSAQYENAFDILSLAYPKGLPKKWDTDVDILILCNLIGAYNDVGRNEEAFKLLEQLGKFVEASKNKKIDFHDSERIPFICHAALLNYSFIKAYTLLCQGNLKQAQTYISLVHDHTTKKNDSFYDICAHIYMIQYYKTLNKKDSALYETEAALQYARNIHAETLEANYLAEKARLLIDSDMEQALEDYDRAMHLQDSLTNNVFFLQMSEVTTQYKADAYQKSNEVYQQKRTALRWLIGSSIVMIILLFVLWCIGRLIQKSLLWAKLNAERSEQFKLIFFANMNHEIRTPLSAITGFSDLLIEETDEETQKEYADIIHDNNDQLTRLISDVLDLSKIEAGTIIFTYTTFDVSDMMHKVYNTIRLRVPEQVKFTLDPIPKMNMTADKGRVMQVMINFLTNAIKHTESGFIRMGYEPFEDKIRFYVSDSGSGIASSQLEEIFTRFVQETDKKGGVGLGLALCKGFVEKMNGEIGVNSQLNQGSLFWFILPVEGQQP